MHPGPTVPFAPAHIKFRSARQRLVWSLGKNNIQYHVTKYIEVPMLRANHFIRLDIYLLSYYLTRFNARSPCETDGISYKFLIIDRTDCML